MIAEVIRHFGDVGYSTVRDRALPCRRWTAIAEVTPEQLVPVLRILEGDDVDAILQVGTNLSMLRLAAAAKMWVAKLGIAINTATWWHALRTNGITDRMDGFGCLMVEF